MKVTCGRLIANRCLQGGLDFQSAELLQHTGSADPRDLPMVVATLREGRSRLVTFNVRPFQPSHPHVTVLRSGEFLSRVCERRASVGVGTGVMVGAGGSSGRERSASN
jgi:hypothetical protein